MAAKPPKPPENLLKSLLNQHNNNRIQQQQQQNNEDDNTKEDNSTKQHLTAIKTSATANHFDNNNIAKSNCNCSNINIMHLFHEMKQEFPTLPDTIVAQYVNENCHQRENCIQVLKHELELNPIPGQSYPAKVLHPPNNNSQTSTNHNNTTAAAAAVAVVGTTITSSIQKPPLQQKPILVQQKPPLKPIKPIRAAPLQPPQQQQTNSKNNVTKINSILKKNTESYGEDLFNNDDFCGGISEGFVESRDITTNTISTQNKQSISTTATTATTTSSVMCTDDTIYFGVGNESTEKNLPRQRPTTLNLNTQLQKQHQLQRHRLNIQLHQRFQDQRNRQQQPHNTTTIIKPLRKAPLPPIAPKPSQFQTNHTNTNAPNSVLNDSLLTNHTTTSPLSESEISVSVSLSTPSPTSAPSPHTTTFNPFDKPTPTLTTNQQHMQTKSPIRHRSVITLQPEPPYTRDFLCNPASLSYVPPTLSSSSPSLAVPSSSANSSPTASVSGSQKSFTSVNLTLRPPASPNSQNSALQPSTIDITAGPGFSGASGGGNSLHYSSTSYDARLGYQQNFQITVTDECGVFTASRIRPQQQQQQQARSLNQVNIKNENQYDEISEKETKINNNNCKNSFLNSEQKSQQQQQQQQQQLQLQQQQKFRNNNVVNLQQNIQNSIQSPGYGGSGTLPYSIGNMCVPTRQAMDAQTQEILQRQKKKRDKLAAALREYKKRLGNVEQEINLLTGTIPTKGLTERLDEDITKLRRDCQDMLRSSNTFVQPTPSQQELAINYQPQQQQEPQPFLRERITRPPQRPPPRQTSLDIIQHHSQISTPHTPPAASLPNLNMNNSLQQLTPLSNNFNNNNNDSYVDHSNFNNETDLVIDDDYDDYEEVVEPWECNMCTFRNHPQLNICETCENVRIIPGRLTNLNYSALPSSDDCTNTNVAATDANVSNTLGPLTSRGPASNNAINNSSRNTLNADNANLEHDTNLVQQQLQHFALHT